MCPSTRPPPAPPPPHPAGPSRRVALGDDQLPSISTNQLAARRTRPAGILLGSGRAAHLRLTISCCVARGACCGSAKRDREIGGVSVFGVILFVQ